MNSDSFRIARLGVLFIATGLRMFFVNSPVVAWFCGILFGIAFGDILTRGFKETK